MAVANGGGIQSNIKTTYGPRIPAEEKAAEGNGPTWALLLGKWRTEEEEGDFEKNRRKEMRPVRK